MRKLPPLNAIKAFEAAARHVSFTRAAKELHVTHGAVSRQVALLEDWCGVALFHRSPSHLDLSDVGATYFRELERIFDRLALASMDMRSQATPRPLLVNAPPTFTMRWLIRNLSGFQRDHSDIEIRLTTSIELLTAHDNSCDVAIRGDHPSQDKLPGWRDLPIMTELIAPVCHRDLSGTAQMVGTSDLRQHRLLTYMTEPYSWSEWQIAAGLTGDMALDTQRFEQMFFALTAVQERLGIALLPIFLVIDELISGELCLPFGMLGARSRPCRVYQRANGERVAPSAQFADWLVQEGKKTEQATQDWLVSSGLFHRSVPPVKGAD